MNNKPKPDDRSNNVERLQDMVQNTIGNMERAEETMMNANSEQRQEIEEKNARRRESIAGMREEIKDEAAARENGQIEG
ncbi:small acid-soluble spore protein Tlp [Pseudobacillus badius]|uniref:small acid-soluble spore protein Tlp n=1 Tax=Bacillus badius TaxID=1455 RepID=UPI0007B07E9E|nr:small acid-soluble spore protein Tlp [Bacillus badius]KZO01795.1 small acid-soluble spore protein Tlp [Bacillus badius]MED0667466.1 small acid-soluble spore protein Tlp [Bacillus badius]OCS90188.1 small acid-soluble spore protein Tlp [Bacillus badius]OVE53717.1 small acid-soluble spore protein Tlp [Bacillus badius]TDW06098.1 small acid-soluble spore protein (thioredoxin-like protein) [Bacillus badius]